MAEGWKAVARRVPAILDPISAVEEDAMDARLPRLIRDASNALRVRWDHLGSTRHGIRHVLDPPSAAPSLLLERANEVLGHDHALHFVGARFLALYGQRLGLLQPAPVSQLTLDLKPGQGQMPNANDNSWWEYWLQGRLEALKAKLQVSRSMRFAAAYDAAVNDAVRVASVLPSGSPDRRSWVRAVELLLLDARAHASQAEYSAHTMRLAVTMESYCAMAIVGST